LAKLPSGSKISHHEDLTQAPDGIGKRIAQFQNESREPVHAVTNSATGDIYIAQNAMNPDAVLGHEVIHSLRVRGVLSDGDLGILEDHANQITGLWDRPAYEKAYAHRENKSELMAQEAAAHLYASRIAGGDFGPRVNSILDHIKEFFERVRSGLKGQGFRSANDVMRSIDSGEMVDQQGRQPGDRPAPSHELGDSLNQN
jgi:hypothetical protein